MTTALATRSAVEERISRPASPRRRTDVQRDVPPRSTDVSLVDLLRGNVRRRPTVDPGLAGGLREWLEDEIGARTAHVDPGAPTVLPLRAITAAQGLRSADVSADPGSTRDTRTLTMPMARGALVGILFRHLVLWGPAPDPIREASEALSVEPHGAELLDFIGALPPNDRARLFGEVAEQSQVLGRRWSRLPAHWLPRTNDRIELPFSGGRVVLCGTVDLVIGAPCQDRASVCLVDLIAGPPRPEHRDELHLAALLETLRSGAPPFRVVSQYASTGETVVEDLTEEHLTRAVGRTVDALASLLDPPAGRS